MSSTTHHVDLSPTSIVIDGHDISHATQSYTLKATAPKGTEAARATLTLDLLIFEGGCRGDAEVIVPVNTREALVALGWTPPPEE